MSTQEKFFGLTLVGDLAEESWPTYLVFQPTLCAEVAMCLIRNCDFRVKCHGRSYQGSCSFVRFIVGESFRSRKCAIDLDDPPGVVYVLQDNGSAWKDDLTAPPDSFVPVKAITLGELVREGYLGVIRHLELDLQEYQLRGIPAM